MKQLLYFLAFTSFAISSCQKSTTDSKSTNLDQPYIKINRLSLSLSGTAGSSNSFNIESNVNWFANKSGAWLNISKTKGSQNGTIHVTTTQTNTSNYIRTATVTINVIDSPSVQPVTIAIIQNPAISNTSSIR